ncbi:MAG TPA: hypothetical protein VL990_13080 [Acidobacteriaceae bacterium]|nr:hypothetical protein [Acidobacteriaceae bacterium]
MTTDILTEEILARAERLYLMAVARGEETLTVYHGKGGIPAGVEREWSAEDEKKWLT